MNTIYAQTIGGLLKGQVKFNTLTHLWDVSVNDTIIDMFPSSQEEEAINKLTNYFEQPDIIKPHVVLLFDDKNPIEIQFKKITGSNFCIGEFEELFGMELIKHIQSGMLIRLISTTRLKEYLFTKSTLENN